MACNRGHPYGRCAKSLGHVCCRGQTGAANRVAGIVHTCHAGIGTDARMCERGVTLCRPSPSVLDLTCSVYRIPPHRCPGDWRGAQSPSTCGNAACAAAISSIDDVALDKMKTGFTVSPGPRGACWWSRVRAPCACAREHARACGRACKRGYGGSDAAGATPSRPAASCR